MMPRLHLLVSFILMSFLLRCCERGFIVDAHMSAKKDKTSPGRRSAACPNDKIAPLNENPKIKSKSSSSHKDLHTFSTKKRSTSADLRNIAKLKDSLKRDATDFKKSFDREERSSLQDPNRIATSVWASSSDLVPQEDLQTSLARKVIPSELNIRVAYHHQ